MCSVQVERLEPEVESQTIKHPVADCALQTIKKPKSMNVNPSSIARSRTASRRELPNNLRRAPRKMIEFRTPHVGPLRTMQNVNRTGATTSMLTERKPSMQNPKNTERHTILRPSPATTRAKPAHPTDRPAAQNPGGRIVSSKYFPQTSPAWKAFPPGHWDLGIGHFLPPLLAPPRQTLRNRLPRQSTKALPDSPVATPPARETLLPPVVILRMTTAPAVDGYDEDVPIAPNISRTTNVPHLPTFPTGRRPAGPTRKPLARRPSPIPRKPAPATSRNQARRTLG
jgi:hypothetical protein